MRTLVRGMGPGGQAAKQLLAHAPGPSAWPALVYLIAFVAVIHVSRSWPSTACFRCRNS